MNTESGRAGERLPLEDREARVSTLVVTRILALVEQLARDPWVGLHAGERAEPRGPVFYLILSSPRIAEGLRRAERFCGLAIDTLRLTVRSDRDVASLIFDVGDATFSRSRHAMEYLLMASVTALRHAVGAEFRLREAQFRHRRAGGRHEAERSFGCPVSFGQREDRIVFPHSALWTTTCFPNRSIAEEIEKFATALSARITPRATIRERVARGARGFHQGRSPRTIHPLDLHYLNLQRELHRTFQTLALAA